MATTIVLKHYGKVVKGVMEFYRPQLLKSNLTELEGKEFELVLKEKYKGVSTDAHAFYRGGILGTALASETFGGWTKDEVHEHFVEMFLSYADTKKIITRNGTVNVPIQKIKSTSALSSKAMKEYCDQVIRWLAQHDIIVLDPDQYELSKQ